MRKSYLVLIIMLLLPLFRLLAQNNPVRNFSVKDGLPSGVVYDCLEDKYGFMWFATEAGLARFDGFGFRVFTTADGLTNNIILQIIEDVDGSIWIFPFGASPCIYDIQTQKILNEKNFPELAKMAPDKERLNMKKTSFGILGQALNGFWVIQNRKAEKIISARGMQIKLLSAEPSRIIVLNNVDMGDKKELIFYGRKNGQWQKDSVLPLFLPMFNKFMPYGPVRQASWGNKMVLTNINEFKIFNIRVQSPASMISESSDKLNSVINTVAQTDSLIHFCTTSGVFEYFFNGKPVGKKLDGVSVSKYYRDRSGNDWYCTLDGRGIYMVLNNGTAIIGKNEGTPTENITALKFNSKGNLITGDVSGNLYSIDTKNTTKGIRQIAKLNYGIRELLHDAQAQVNGVTTSEVFRVSDNDFFVRKDFGTQSFKALLPFPEGIATVQAFSLELLSQQFEIKERIITLISRISCVARNGDDIYFGNNTGLYKTDKQKRGITEYDQVAALPVKAPLTTLYYTAGGLLFAGTSNGKLIVLNRDSVVASISLLSYEKGTGSVNVKKIVEDTGKNRVWVATNKGISVINYSFVQNRFLFSERALSSKDGLADNDVNDIALRNDTVYAATIKGITIFPAAIREIRVPLFITDILVNNGGFNLSFDSLNTDVSLKHFQNNITIKYNAICYTCDRKISYEYRLLGRGRDTNWIATNAGEVEFGELPPGKYTFEVRTAWSNVKRVKLNIRAAFWQTTWFYVFVGLLFLLLGYFLFRWYAQRLNRKQQQQIALNRKLAELELKALQSQMNPHFIFNSMNSLQLYILTQDIEKANDYLAGFSSLLRLFLEASRSRYITISKEMELLNQYMRLEQMRQIGSFEYRLTAGNNVDTGMLIPSVIIQPFVENAIVHGLRHREGGNGLLKVHLDVDKSNFICTVEDNGVGREQARIIRERKDKQYQSFGTSLVMDKIETLRKMEQLDINVEINDLVTGAGETAGTRVTIKIKLPVSV